MSQININAQQFSFITNNLNCDHNSFTFILSFLLCSHSASFTLCYVVVAAAAAASVIITFFHHKACAIGESKRRFLVTMREKLRRNFGEFMFLSRAECYLLFITVGTVDHGAGKNL